MLFQTDITIPANTAKTSPATVRLGISKGVITKFMVRPRAGHASLAHCVIKYHEHIIAPTTEGMSLSGDAFPIDWEDHIEVLQQPLELKIYGWNEDDTFPHTFTIYVVILPKAALLVFAITAALGGLFGRLLPKRVSTGGGTGG
ncbi:hypothetical protein LCGC14_1281070 [marine sediment metagenome]|uniref:Uncharacterized protein n=1 Tax=marine sediment metagenome TaxID=412755 RepID=A0A0F9LGA0_9ZZZZ